MKYFSFFALLGISFLFAACGQSNTATIPSDSQKPVFATSFYPLAFFAEQIAGTHATVINLAGNAEIHDFSPSVQDMTTLLSSSVFFYHGAGLEHWAEDMAKELNKKNIPTVELSSFVALQKREAHDHEHDHEHEEGEHEDEHEHGEFDPHTWLDPVLAQSLATVMAKKMMETSPQNAEEYAKNLAVLQQKLSSLDASFVSKLKNCTHREVIVSHDAFGYLAQRYGFTTHAIAGVSTNDEPSAKVLAALQEEAKEGIKAILAEQNSVQRFAKTIADATGLQMLAITTLETPAENYFDGMQKNLNALSVALQCQ